jgi:hypothetical protein
MTEELVIREVLISALFHMYTQIIFQPRVRSLVSNVRSMEFLVIKSTYCNAARSRLLFTSHNSTTWSATRVIPASLPTRKRRSITSDTYEFLRKIAAYPRNTTVSASDVYRPLYNRSFGFLLPFWLNYYSVI